MTTLQQAATQRALVLQLAAREHGVRPEDMLAHGKARSTANRLLMRLAREGLLHRAQVTYKHVAYFASADGAQAYLTAHGRRTAPRHAKRDDPHARPWLGGRAPWPADAPAIVTPATIITRCPAPPRALRTNTHSPW